MVNDFSDFLPYTALLEKEKSPRDERAPVDWENCHDIGTKYSSLTLVGCIISVGKEVGHHGQGK